MFENQYRSRCAVTESAEVYLVTTRSRERAKKAASAVQRLTCMVFVAFLRETYGKVSSSIAPSIFSPLARLRAFGASARQATFEALRIRWPTASGLRLQPLAIFSDGFAMR